MNLIDAIAEAMQDDDADAEEQSGHLIEAWNDADLAARELLDRAFIALCGYSLTTLIRKL